MDSATTVDLEKLRSAVEHVHGLDVLALFGSQARGMTTEISDWDFAFVGARVDIDMLFTRLARTLGTDEIDLVDLESAGALVRSRVAQEGLMIFESRAGAFHAYCYEAALFWCDAGAVIEAAYDDYLSRYGATFSG